LLMVRKSVLTSFLWELFNTIISSDLHVFLISRSSGLPESLMLIRHCGGTIRIETLECLTFFRTSAADVSSPFHIVRRSLQRTDGPHPDFDAPSPLLHCQFAGRFANRDLQSHRCFRKWSNLPLIRITGAQGDVLCRSSRIDRSEC
jgi:hypothetical protein